MIIEYRDRDARRSPGPYYTFNYDTGSRAKTSDFQGDIRDLEEYGRNLAKERGREIRLRIHDHRGDRLYAVFGGKKGGK